MEIYEFNDNDFDRGDQNKSRGRSYDSAYREVRNNGSTTGKSSFIKRVSKTNTKTSKMCSIDSYGLMNKGENWSDLNNGKITTDVFENGYLNNIERRLSRERHRGKITDQKLAIEDKKH